MSQGEAKPADPKPESFSRQDVAKAEVRSFDRGFESAKLDAFLVLAKQGKDFVVCPSCFKYVVPLVAARIRELSKPRWTWADFNETVRAFALGVRP
jgi:hypothetical protein